MYIGIQVVCCIEWLFYFLLLCRGGRDSKKCSSNSTPMIYLGIETITWFFNWYFSNGKSVYLMKRWISLQHSICLYYELIFLNQSLSLIIPSMIEWFYNCRLIKKMLYAITAKIILCMSTTNLETWSERIWMEQKSMSKGFYILCWQFSQLRINLNRRNSGKNFSKFTNQCAFCNH